MLTERELSVGINQGRPQSNYPTFQSQEYYETRALYEYIGVQNLFPRKFVTMSFDRQSKFQRHSAQPHEMWRTKL